VQDILADYPDPVPADIQQVLELRRLAGPGKGCPQSLFFLAGQMDKHYQENGGRLLTHGFSVTPYWAFLLKIGSTTALSA
jgi:hypothetical protein